MLKRLAILTFVVCACAAELARAHPPCTVDSDCSAGEICFPDGCGDPGIGLAVEISGNSTEGLNPQDVWLGDAGFAATQDFSFAEPMILTGHFQRDVNKPVPYTDPTSLVLTGESAVIPGILRTYQASFSGTDQGAYSVPIGAGLFNLRAAASDTSIPPIHDTGLRVDPGQSPALDFQFSSPTATLILVGRLIKKTELTVPPTQINLTAAQQSMDIIALDPGTQQPLSQVTHVSSGLPISDGSFQVFIDPSAKLASAINLVASPRDPTALMPSKTFTLMNSGSMTNPYPSGDQLVLEMGDYGDSFPTVYSADGGGLPRVLTSDGLAVENAVVSMSGPVAGGGVFTSTPVMSSTDGTFSIGALPSDPLQSFTLTVIPPTSSPAGITKRQVNVYIDGGMGAISPGDIYSDDKVTVAGTLLRPDGTPAANVLTTAVPISALPDDPDQPLPTSTMQANTDASGNFSFLLDPRVWRFDFTPGEALPITSRVLVVRRMSSSGGTITPIQIPPLTLRKGRQVTGHVSLPASQGAGPASHASVRFFHVDTIEQQASALLIGEAVCDEQGNYTVVLPTAN